MAGDDDFRPQLGRMRAKGKVPRKFLSRVIAAANLARGGSARGQGRSAFTGTRIGRGVGVGRVLGARDRFAAFRQRRVIVKARTISLRGKGLGGAKAHLRYVERDGTTREGGRGHLYAAESDAVDRAAWLEKAQGDRHQFRFIVSAEDGADYDDLRPLTRRLMARVEEDLGTSLDWVAVDHFNTGHPHTHIIVRGKDDQGKDLIIARDYMSHGLRERACELVDLDLGPRTDHDIARRLRAEIDQDRLTSIDRALLREAVQDTLVSSEARGAFSQAIRIGRLRKLERLGLASQEGALHWHLSPTMEAALRRMGERGDIVRTMQRAYASRGKALPLAEHAIFEPAFDRTPLVGRIVERGLSDEHQDRHYLILEATDGRSHYVDIGKGNDVAPQAIGAIVRISPVEIGVRDVDRTIAAVAAANEGRYSVDAHLQHDPSASQAFAEAHVRRLEAMRRGARNVERLPDGTWLISGDHLERALAYESMLARDKPVRLETLSSVPIEQLGEVNAATWLDRELVSDDPLPLRDAGFGRDVRAAQAARRQWLLGEGFASEQGEITIFRRDMVATLQRREFNRAAAQLAVGMGKPFTEAASGEHVEGRMTGKVELHGGTYGVVERTHDFTLVPWRSVLEDHLGKRVAGIKREDGVNWTFRRQRAGPSIS